MPNSGLAPARRVDRILLDRAQLLVVDIQERLVPKIHGADGVIAKAIQMIEAAAVLDLPTTISEQYVKGLGPTDARVAAAAATAPRFEKLTFSFCADAACSARLADVLRPQVLLVGIEAHVCVLQTALDLIDKQFVPVVLADAVGSRSPRDAETAIERVRGAGAVVTTVESVIFELLRESGTELFKRILPIVK